MENQGDPRRTFGSASTGCRLRAKRVCLFTGNPRSPNLKTDGVLFGFPDNQMGVVFLETPPLKMMVFLLVSQPNPPIKRPSGDLRDVNPPQKNCQLGFPKAQHIQRFRRRLLEPMLPRGLAGLRRDLKKFAATLPGSHPVNRPLRLFRSPWCFLSVCLLFVPGPIKDLEGRPFHHA